MSYPIHPLSNVGVAGQYLNQLARDDISQRYFSGLQSYNGGFFERFKLFFSINATLKQLLNFYPYVPVVKASVENYALEKQKAVVRGLAITGISWFTIFSLGRRGKVLPFFNLYDKFFKTHRIFRQYLFALVVPITLLIIQVNYKYLNHTEHLWAIHARRMNQKITQDPENSEYPEHLLPFSWIGAWKTPYHTQKQISQKHSNEVNLLMAPDYLEPNYQLLEDFQSKQEGQKGQEGQEGQEEEASEEEQ